MEALLMQLAPLYLAREDAARTGLAWSAHIMPERVVDAAQKLYDAGFHLEDICGLDVAEGLCAVYHYNRMDQHQRLELRVMVTHDAPQLPSITAVYAGAEWHEREAADFYGLVFEGNPNTAPLLMPEGMQGYPLLKQPAARVHAAALFAAASPEREVIHRAEGFTLLDAPEPAAKTAKAAKPAKAAPAATTEAGHDA